MTYRPFSLLCLLIPLIIVLVGAIVVEDLTGTLMVALIVGVILAAVSAGWRFALWIHQR